MKKKKDHARIRAVKAIRTIVRGAREFIEAEKALRRRSAKSERGVNHE